MTMLLLSFQPSIANATNIDTLIAGTEGKEEVNIPPESIQDKVFFIFNNLSLANMDQKVSEPLPKPSSLVCVSAYELYLCRAVS